MTSKPATIAFPQHHESRAQPTSIKDLINPELIDAYEYPTSTKQIGLQYFRLSVKPEVREELRKNLFKTKEQGIVSSVDVSDMRNPAQGDNNDSDNESEDPSVVRRRASGEFKFSVRKLLHELDGAIVSINVRTKTDQVFNPLHQEMTFVGYTATPTHLVRTYFRGFKLLSDKYKEAEYSIPSRPTDKKSVEGYFRHSTTYRKRTRGRSYCIFYMNHDVVAADDKNIYPLRKHGERYSLEASMFAKNKLDKYTHEALLYIFDLSKVNVKQANKGNVDYSTHNHYTFLLVFVKKPDDVLFNTEQPYDVICTMSNILPIFNIHKLTQRPAKEPDNYVEGAINFFYESKTWFEKFSNVRVPGESKMQVVDVFDRSTMASAVYCSRQEHLIEVIIGDNPNVKSVFDRLVRLLNKQPIKYQDYEETELFYENNNEQLIPITPSNKKSFFKFVKDNFRSFYLNGLVKLMYPEPRAVPLTQAGLTAIVREKFEEIAYTIYCKVVANFGDICDMTQIINKGEPKLKTFERSITIRRNKGVSNTHAFNPKPPAYPQRSPYTFNCGVVIPGGTLGVMELYPLEENCVTRSISARSGKVNWLLAQLYRQGNQSEYSLKLPVEQEDDSKDPVIEDNGIPGEIESILKAKVPFSLIEAAIIFIATKGIKSLPITRQDVQEFRNNVKTRNFSTFERSSTIQSKELLQVSIEGNVITVQDELYPDGRKREYTFPFTEEIEIINDIKNESEPKLKKFYDGKLDMETLSMLFDIISPTLIMELLEKVGRDYNAGGLGAFLYENLISKQFSKEQVERLTILLETLEKGHLQVRDIDKAEYAKIHSKPLTTAFIDSERTIAW